MISDVGVIFQLSKYRFMNNPKNRRILAVMLVAAVIAGPLILLIPKLGQRRELNFACEFHEKFYRNEIVGSVVNHFVDSADHARRTVIVKDQSGVEYEIWASEKDFDRIR